MRKYTIFLLFVIFIAFFLRLYRVAEMPPSLNWDEVSIGYNAYSILQTGRDEWGQLLPLHFKSYGEYKLPGQIYASIPAIALFGLNSFGVRITPAIYGTLTVLLLYFLARELFKRKDVALISAFLLAVSPWHIQLTRGSFESSFALFWVALGVWFLVKGFKEPKYWIFSTIPLALATYTYNSARVFVPLFLLVGVLIYWRRLIKYKKEFFLAFFAFILLMLPTVPFFLSGEGEARYKLVSVTDEAGLVPRIEERRNLSTSHPTLTRLIHNRVTYISYYASANYLAHFTPDFLFVSGAPHKQHHPQGIGQLYLIQAPFLLLGLYLLFRKRHKFRWLLAAWMLLAFVPVAFTLDSIPHALRTLNAAPTYQLISAFGFVYGYKLFRKKWLKQGVVFLVIAAFAWQFAGYLGNYYKNYPILYSRDWQYGNKQVVEFIKKNLDDYDLIVYSRTYGEPHMFTLFYLNYPPADYYNNPNLVRYESHDWVWVLKFDKFYFPDLGDEGTRYEDIIGENPDKKILFIGKPGDFPEESKELLRVKFLNNNSAFEIVEKTMD